MSLNTTILRKNVLATALLLATGAALAAPVVDAQTKDVKSIVIVDSPAATPLQVEAKALKSSYNVGEPIQFKLKANKDVYFYLFSLDEDENATLLIPNHKVTDNFLKAGRNSVFPNGDMPALEGTKAGKENLVVVATTKEIDFDDKDFSTKSIYSQTKTASLKKQFASKDIVWVDESKPEANSVNQDNASFYFTVKITSPIPTPVANQNPTVEALLGGGAGASNAGILADGNMVTVSSDKRKYRVGEAVELVYGSTSAGYIYVYADDNEGNRIPVARDRIKAGELKKMTVVADRPTGKTTFRAYLSKRGDTDYTKAIVIRDDANTAPDKEAIAVHTIQVVSK